MNRFLPRCTSQRREQTVMHLRVNLCQYRLRAGIEYCLLWLRDYILLASLRVVIMYNTHNHLIIYNVKWRPNIGKIVLIPNRFDLRPRPPLSHHRVARPLASLPPLQALLSFFHNTSSTPPSQRLNLKTSTSRFYVIIVDFNPNLRHNGTHWGFYVYS